MKGFLLLFLIGGPLLLSGCENRDTKTASNDRDNSAVNQRDSDGDTKTPFDQSNTKKDTELVAKLRSEILKIEDLSISARNIKIITNDGRVRLRGPVASVDERDAIVKVAHAIAGKKNVTNELEVIE